MKEQIKEAPEQWRDFLAQFDAGFPLVTSLFRITTPPVFPGPFRYPVMYVRCPEDETPGIDNYELVEGRFVRPQDVVDAGTGVKWRSRRRCCSCCA